MIQIALTQAQFDAVSARLKSEGVSITALSGQIKRDGVIAGWIYDGANVTVTVLHRPPFETMGYIEGKIRAWFAHNEVSAPAQPARL